jgi:hypothetical protein
MNRSGSGGEGASCDLHWFLLAVDHALGGFRVARTLGLDLRIFDLA